MVPLRRPTADTALLVQAAVLGLRSIYQPGFELTNSAFQNLPWSVFKQMSEQASEVKA